ncbi:MAG: glycosyltransferase family 2 protein [Syntrophaceae bacterium]|nr:glycosyltransferase family 2 protein [Syntrophaceae bacterium]
MTKKIAVIISPNYLDHAVKYLPDCIESLRRQDWRGEKKIFITDNQTTDKSYEFLKETAPEVEVVRNEENDGFAKGNNDAMRLALQESFDYIILFNMDSVIAPDCITQLVETAERSSLIGAVQARIMFWPEKDKVNSLGNVSHFLGFGYCDGYGEGLRDVSLQAMKKICYPSGAAVLYKKEVLEKVGLFDEEFWMYNEDQDLGWRIWLAGWQCVLAERAIVYHKYEYSRNTGKYYWLDRNRILAMLKNYHMVTLLFISFAFFVMEFGLLLFAFQNGWLKGKMNVYKYFLKKRTWQYIAAEREKTQALRKVHDRDIITMFSGRIWYPEIGGLQLRLANQFFSLYWFAVKRIVALKPASID